MAMAADHLISKWRNGVHSINAAALIIGAASLLSRVLGLLRDRLLAAHFGASRELDVYYAAFRVPDFLFTLLLLGAASVAIIPIFSELRSRGEEEARSLIDDLVTLFLAVGGLVCFAAFVLAPFIMRWLTPGFGAEDLARVVFLTRLMLVSPILLGLSTIISTVTQVYRRFLVYALPSVFYNIGIIIGILFFLPRWGITGVALGVVLGTIFHVFVQLPTFYELGYRLSFQPHTILRALRGRVSRSVQRVAFLSFPRIVALAASQITLIALVSIASSLAEGSISVFQFATNLMYLPVGIFGASFSVAAFPALNEYFTKRDGRAFYDTFQATVRQVLFWVMPLAVLFYVLRAQIVRVALGAGQFSWADTRLTAAALGILAIAILAESLLPTIIRSFYALENTKKPLLFDAATSIFTIAAATFLALLFADPGGALPRFFTYLLRVEDVPRVSVLGLALAISIGSVLNVALLWRELVHELQQKFGIHGRSMNRYEIAKIVSASFAAGAVAYGMLRVMIQWVTLDTFWGVFLQGVASFVIGAVVYAGLLFAFRNQEMRTLIETIRRKLFSTAVLPEELNGVHLK